MKMGRLNPDDGSVEKFAEIEDGDLLYLFWEDFDRPVFELFLDQEAVLTVRTACTNGMSLSPESGNVVRIRAVRVGRERTP